MSLDFEESRTTWELLNSVQHLENHLYYTNVDEQNMLLSTKPWSSCPTYFKKVQISAASLIKMVIHARSGGNLEVMGLLQGKLKGDAFIVTDTFALPVEGTETRVNAGAEATEYMVNFQSAGEQIGRVENIVGWYHSHPSYGCWLSGIDVETQMLYQQHQEPFVAIVIDPTKTCAAGKVELGAFRTYPKDYTAVREKNMFQTVPANKIKDFGLHWKQYYSLEVEVYKSSLDVELFSQLWAKYWAYTLSAAPLITNKEYYTSLVHDLSEKLRTIDISSNWKSRSAVTNKNDEAVEDPLKDAAKQSFQLISEIAQASTSEILKVFLFGRLRRNDQRCNKMQQEPARIDNDYNEQQTSHASQIESL